MGKETKGKGRKNKEVRMEGEKLIGSFLHIGKERKGKEKRAGGK